MAKFVINAGYAPSLIGFRGDLIKSIIANGHEVTAIAPGLNGEIRSKLLDWGVECIDAPLNRAGVNPVSDLGYLWFLIKTFRKIKPDALFSYTIKPVIYGGIASWVTPVKRVYALISGLGYAFTGEIKGVKRILNFLVKLLYRMGLYRSKVTFFQNPDDRSLFTSESLVKESKTCLVNGSGVNLDTFSFDPISPDKVEKTRFLFIGRLLTDKGIYEYVQAAKILKPRYPELEFHIVGWIDDNPAAVSPHQLEQWIESKDIVYHGKLSDVRQALINCDVFVLPSYREGTPRTVLEAMAIGRAIITTDAPGCRETVLNGKNGFLVPVKDADALAIVMEKFVHNGVLRKTMAEESRKIAEQKYDVRLVNRHMIEAMNLGE